MAVPASSRKGEIIINLLTVDEVAERLHMGKTNTYKLFSRKDFPKITIGKKLLIKEEDLEKYIDKYVKGIIKL